MARQLGQLLLVVLSFLAGPAASDEAAALPVANDYMCQCEFKDNNWVHQFEALLRHVQELPTILQHPEHPATRWVMAQACDEDASVFPNTEIIFDMKDVMHVRRAAVMPASGGRMEVHHFCFPGQAAMAMICAQQYLVKGVLRGVLKWVEKMAELLSVIKDCMDAESPLPLRFKQFEAYLGRFQGSIPTPDHREFIPLLAFSANAQLKTYAEAAEPMHECLPLKDPECFPRHTINQYESCSECCHPKAGPKGNPECWVGPYTYDRCCRHSPRPWKVEPEGDGPKCQGQDAKNAELAKALEAEVKGAKELGREKNFLKEDLKIAQEEAEALRKKLAAQEEELRMAHETSRELGVLANESRAQIDALREELTAGGGHVAQRLEQELQEARAASTASEQQLQEAQAASEASKQALQEARAAGEASEQALQEARAASEASELALHEARAAGEASEQALQEALAACEASKHSANASEDETAELRRLGEEAQQQLEEAQAARDASQREAEGLREELRQCGEEATARPPAESAPSGAAAAEACRGGLNASVQAMLEDHRKVQLCRGYLTFVSNCAFNDMGPR